VTIRTAVPEDAEAVAALRRTVFPYLLMSAAQVRRAIADSPPAERFAGWVTVSGDELVGWGSCGLNTWTSEPGIGTLNVYVHPEHRMRGLGGTLLDAAEGHLAEIGVRRVQTFVTQDSVAFAAGRGYEPNREMHYASVDLRNLPEQPPTPPDVTLVPVSGVGPRPMYVADAAVSLDEPSDAPADAIEYDAWLHEIWNGPMIDHDLSVAAMVGGTVAAFSSVEVDGDRAWSAMTGTVRAHRGRGLAKLVKSVALRRAAAAGIVSASTSNDDRNGPMLAVNDWLGYRRVATHLGVTRDL